MTTAKKKKTPQFISDQKKSSFVSVGGHRALHDYELNVVSDPGELNSLKTTETYFGQELQTEVILSDAYIGF